MSYNHMNLQGMAGIKTQLKLNSAHKSLLGIGTKIHTLRNGESETQQGLIDSIHKNTSIDI